MGDCPDPPLLPDCCSHRVDGALSLPAISLDPSPLFLEQSRARRPRDYVSSSRGQVHLLLRSPKHLPDRFHRLSRIRKPKLLLQLNTMQIVNHLLFLDRIGYVVKTS